MRWGVILGVVLAAAGFARAQPTTPPPAHTPDEVLMVHRHSGAATLTLGNGVRVHVRAMPDSRGTTGRVLVLALVSGVELDEDAHTRGTSQLAADALDAGAGGGATLTPEGLTLRFEVTGPESVSAALGVVRDVVAAPVFDAARFEHGKSTAIGHARRAEAQRENTGRQRVGDAMLRLMTPSDDPRLRKPTSTELDAVTFDRATASLRAHLADCPLDVAIVGAVTPADVFAAARAALGTLPPRRNDPMAERRRVVRITPPPDARRVILQGPVPTGQTLISVSLPAPTVGGATLEDARCAAVAARLLENEGRDALAASGVLVRLASGVAMTGRVYPALGTTVGSFMVSGDEAAARRAGDALADRIVRLRVEGPSDVAVTHAVDDALRELEPRIKSMDYWASVLATSWFLDVRIDDLGGAPDALRRVTRERLHRHLTRWWAEDRTIQVTVTPPPAPPPASPPSSLPQPIDENPAP